MLEFNIIADAAEQLAQKGEIEQALELFLDAIDGQMMADDGQAEEVAYQMGWFLFQHHFYEECLETWRKLQQKGYRREEISQTVEEAFVAPNEKEFQGIYDSNLEKYKTNIHTEDVPLFKELPDWLLPAGEGVYYLFGKKDKVIGEKITASVQPCTDDEIFNGENAFDTTIFWKDWDYEDPLKGKRRNRKQVSCFLSEGGMAFSYLQFPEFQELFQEGWHIFSSLESMKDFFHNNQGIPLPRIYKGIRGDAGLFQEWIGTEHKFRCTKEGRDKGNILLTIGIPSYNRGHRALENIRHLQNLSYDAEVEFLVVDNCSQLNVEGYQEIEKMAETDSRITYYRFPDKPGDNPSPAETVKRASGRFCCLLSDEDLVYLDNVWKYLYLIQKYGDTVGFINAAGRGYYHSNVNQRYTKGEEAFGRVFWALNYMSGLVFCTDIYHKLKLYGLYCWETGNGKGNYFKRGYPHNAAAMRCSIETDVYTCGELLFQEGKEDKVSASYQKLAGNQVLEFATVENRLKQLKGIVALLNEWKGMISQKQAADCYGRAIGKVFFLIDLYRQQGGVIECSYQEAHRKIIREGIKGIEELEVGDKEYADIVISVSYWFTEYMKACKEEA